MKTLKLMLLIGSINYFALSSGAAITAETDLEESGNFSGAYVGAGLSVDYISVPIHGGSHSDTSIAYNALVGWRHQLENNWVFGVEGALGDREGGLEKDGVRLKFGYNWHWSAIVGKVFGASKQQLVYAKFGVGGIQVKATAHGQRLPSHNFKGARYAVGYERPLTYSVNVRAEASYISYDPDFDQVQATLSLIYNF